MGKKLDLDGLRLPESLAGQVQKARPKKAGQQKIKGQFIKGPIPQIWLVTASKCGNTALWVGLNLWYLSGLRKGALTFPVSNVELAKLDIDRKQKYEAVKRLKRAGLISTRQIGHASVEVTILCAFGETPGESSADRDEDEAIH